MKKMYRLFALMLALVLALGCVQAVAAGVPADLDNVDLRLFAEREADPGQGEP